MPDSIAQSSFTTGELSPSLYGRVDLNRYSTGLKTCRNAIVRQYGGVSNRPGTLFISETKYNSKKSRLIPFIFSTVQAYVLEFGDYYMRVYKDGGQVVYPAGHADAGDPVEIVTPWAEADLPRLKWTQNADVLTICHPDCMPQQISRTDHHLWTIADFANEEGPFDDINIDTSKTMLSSATTGIVTITSSWDFFTANMVGELLYLEQTPDDTTPRWDVAIAVAPGSIYRAGANFYYTAGGGTTGTVRPTLLYGSEQDGSPGVQWTYLHSGYGCVKITAVTDAKHATATVTKTLPKLIVASTGGSNKTVSAVSANVNGQLRMTAGSHSIANGVQVTAVINWQWYGVVSSDEYGDVYGYVAKTTYVTKDCYVVDANTVDVPFAWPPPGYSSFTSGTVKADTVAGVASYKWARQAWNEDDGYPGAATYHQQRLIFSGTRNKPNYVWMSCTAAFYNFGKTVPSEDADAITIAVSSNQVNEGRYFLPLSELILLTSGGEWTIRGDSDGVFTPTSINVHNQGFSGVNYLPGLMAGNGAIFVQAKGAQVRSISYNYASDSFIGIDLTVLSEHLFRGHQIIDWAYQHVPYACAWCVREDGILMGLTYMQEQEVIGWHRHDTDGLFESVVSIPEGTEDAVYCIVNRTINGSTKRYIERFSTRNFETEYDYIFMDSALSYDGTNTGSTTITITGGTAWDHTETLTATASASMFAAGDIGDAIFVGGVKLIITGYTSGTVVTVQPNKAVPSAYQSTAFTDWQLARNGFAGLDHLEGKTVAILADGNVHPSKVVTSGAIAMDYPAAIVHIGLPYITDVETLDMNVPGQFIRDRFKSVARVNMIVEETKGVWCGPDALNLTEYKQRNTENYDDPVAAVSGMITINIPSNWSKGGRVFIRQVDPLPMTILSIIPEVVLGGT